MSDAVPAPPVSADSAPQPPAPFRCTRAEKPFDPLYLKAEAEKMNAYADLGLFSDARECAEKYLADWEVEYVRSHAMFWAMRQQDFQAAEAHANIILSYPHALHPSTLESLPVVLHYAGRDGEAYHWAKVATRLPHQRPGAFCYSLACYALPVKKEEESLQAILECFAGGNSLPWEPWRKAFLDSELAPLWEYVRQRTYTIKDAIEWAAYPLEKVLQTNLVNQNPRMVDFDDLRTMPDEFAKLFKQANHNTALLDPAVIRAEPDLFKKYQRWEEAICAPRIEAFAHLVSEVRGVYDRHLPEMIRFCLSQQRHGPARFILRMYLRRHPQTNPHTFPDLPGFDYWCDEWKELWDVSPEGLQLLIDRAPGEDAEYFLATEFASLPARLKESGLGWMVLGLELKQLKEIEEAIAAFKKAEKFWPLDDAPVINHMACLVCDQRWEEVMELVEHPTIQAWSQPDRWFLQSRLSKKIPSYLPKNPRENLHFPTPSFGTCDLWADHEFLHPPKPRPNASTHPLQRNHLR